MSLKNLHIITTIIAAAGFLLQGCPAPKTLQGIQSQRYISQRTYELNDHLGNVRVAVQDYTLSEGPVASETASYFPFGMQIPEKMGTYAFGFNGEETDHEAGESGDWVHFKFREFSSRTARFSQTDPLEFRKPSLSPYHFAGNNPINRRDAEGLEDAKYSPSGAVFEIRSDKMHTDKDWYPEFDAYNEGFYKQPVTVLNTANRSEVALRQSLQSINFRYRIQGQKSVEGLVIHSHGGGSIFHSIKLDRAFEIIGEEISQLRAIGAQFEPDAYMVISSCWAGQLQWLPDLKKMAAKSGLYIVATSGQINHTHHHSLYWKGDKEANIRILFSDEEWILVAPDGSVTRIVGQIYKSGNYIRYDDIRRTIDETIQKKEMEKWVQKRIEAGEDHSAPEFDDPDFEENTSVEKGMSQERR